MARIGVTVGSMYKSIIQSFTPFSSFIEVITESSIEYLNTFDLIVLSGGSDISPIIYNEDNRNCHIASEEKDRFEIDIIIKSIRLNKKLFGICRGHQLINAVLGASLYQDLSEMPSNHYNDIDTGRHILQNNPALPRSIVPRFFKEVNSLHHQAIKSPGIFLDTTTMCNCSIESTENDQIITVQFHPEVLSHSATFFNYVAEWSKFRFRNLYKEVTLNGNIF